MRNTTGGYLQAPYNLSKKVKDVRISVLAHRILYRWQQASNGKRDVFVPIRDIELANTIFVTTRSITKFVGVLEEIGFLTTKRGQGAKYYKVNLAEARKYFNV